MPKQNTKRSDAQVWSMIIAGAGLAFLAVIETASAVYAFRTGDKSIMILGLPLDAMLKTAASLVVAIAAFGGAIIAQSKRGKGRLLAYAVTALCFGWTAVNFSGFTAYARQASDAAQIKESVLYKQALETVKIGGDGYADYDARKEAQAVIQSGEPPVTAERQFGDLLRAVVAIALVWGMAAAFRVPTPAAPSQKRSAASETAKGGWVGEKGEKRRADIAARRAQKPKLVSSK